jgi:hypothetical protein
MLAAHNQFQSVKNPFSDDTRTQCRCRKHVRCFPAGLWRVISGENGDLIPHTPNLIARHPRSVVVNHAGLWIRRRRFESARGYPVFRLLIRFESGRTQIRLSHLHRARDQIIKRISTSLLTGQSGRIHALPLYEKYRRNRYSRELYR